MGTTLTGTTPQDTYDSLIKVTDNGPLSGTAKYLSDGLGNDSALALSTGNIGIGTDAPSQQLHIVNADDAVVKIESSGTDAIDDARIELTTTNGTFNIQNDRSIGTSGALTFAGNVSNNIVIDHNSGNVGIGTGSPTSGGVSSTLRVKQASDAVSGFTGIGIESAAATGELLYFGNTGTTAIIGQTYLGTGAYQPIAFSVSGSERFRITNSGVTFNGDTAAANALDDYEEGTFTPFLSFSGGVTGITYSQQLGRYTKIGNVVNFVLVITLTDKGSSTGEARIEGLPFTLPSGGVNYVPFNIGAILNTTFNTLPSAVGIITTTYMVLEENVSGGAQSPLTQADIANNTEMRISGTYFV